MSMVTHASGYKVDAEKGVVYGRKGNPFVGRNSANYTMVNNNKGFVGAAHRIIWESVYGPIPEGLWINHVNGVKWDNRIANLELVTPSENQRHAYRNGLASQEGERHSRHKLTEAQVIEIRESSDTRKVLASRYGVHYDTICDIITRKRWKHLPSAMSAESREGEKS